MQNNPESKALEQRIQAFLTCPPTNPVHRQLVDEDFTDDELELLENPSPEFVAEYLEAVEQGVWI